MLHDWFKARGCTSFVVSSTGKYAFAGQISSRTTSIQQKERFLQKVVHHPVNLQVEFQFLVDAGNMHRIYIVARRRRAGKEPPILSIRLGVGACSSAYSLATAPAYATDISFAPTQGQTCLEHGGSCDVAFAASLSTNSMARQTPPTRPDRARHVQCMQLVASCRFKELLLLRVTSLSKLFTYWIKSVHFSHSTSENSSSFRGRLRISMHPCVL